MILGLHDMRDSVTRYWRERVSADGGLWLVALDSLLLIPLIFSVFFFPIPVLIGVTVLAVVAAMVYEVRHFARTHHAHWFWHRH